MATLQEITNKHSMPISMIATLLLFPLGSCRVNEIVDPPPGETPGKQTDIEWPSLAKSPWPMFGGNPQFTGRSRYTGPVNSAVIQWTLSLPGVNRNQSITSPVMGADSTIYFGSSYESIMFQGVLIRASFLNAVSQEGKLKWKVRLGKDSIDIGSEDVFTTPVVLSDNSIVLATPRGYIMSFSSEGKLNWVYESIFKVFNNKTITPGKNGDLYIVDAQGELYSLTNKGTLNWKLKLDDGFSGSANSAVSISPDGSTLYVCGTNNSKLLYAISTDGKLKWSFDAKEKTGVPPLIDNNGCVYFGTNSVYNDTIYATLYVLNNNGKVRWKYIKNESYFDSPALDNIGNIYFYDDPQNIYSLDYNGNLRWKYNFGINGSSVILCDFTRTIYSLSNELTILSYEGILVKKINISSWVWTMPMIGFNNDLYITSVGNTSNYLIKIK